MKMPLLELTELQDDILLYFIVGIPIVVFGILAAIAIKAYAERDA